MTHVSAQSEKRGCLYLVATPIGNLEDITLRALRVLREVDLIACEDTRQTQKLLNHYDIRKRLVSYHEHNERRRAPELVAEMQRGASVALVSNAGMPLVSDPGQHLVARCIESGIPVVPVPGPSALVAALAASGMPDEEFVFAGFLPARAGERRKALAALAGEPRVLVFYEAPHRIVATLEDILTTQGNRDAVIARELTKIHEEFLRGTIEELLARLRRTPPRGEMTLLVAPASQERKAAVTSPLAERVAQIMRERGGDQKAALKQAARERGLTKRQAYREMLASRALEND
jgi:16S rRNA (cytidine1402-2'-O)-methyltransferase